MFDIINISSSCAKLPSSITMFVEGAEEDAINVKLARFSLLSQALCV